MKGKILVAGWLIGTLCGLCGAYGIQYQSRWWAFPMIAMCVPAGVWIVFGSILTMVYFVDILTSGSIASNDSTGE